MWWESETVIPLKGVLRMQRQKMNIATIRRWCRIGLLINGSRIRLESFKEGRERFTTVEAYRRFISRQNE